MEYEEFLAKQTAKFNEIKKRHNGVPAEATFNHLMERSEAQPSFMERMEMEGKSLNGCFKYVMVKVREQVTGSSGWVDDDVVYQMAKDYYMSDELDKVQPPQEKPKPKVEKEADPQTTVEAEDVPEVEEESKVLLLCTQEVYGYENDEYIIKAPSKLRDILNEGSALKHCVGTYYERVVTNKSVILFLRSKEKPSKPLITIEIKSGRIVQSRGKKNREPNAKELEFIKEFEENRLKKKQEKYAV